MTITLYDTRFIKTYSLIICFANKRNFKHNLL